MESRGRGGRDGFSVFSEDPEYECEKLFPYVDYVFLSYDGKKDEHIREWVKKSMRMAPSW